VTIVKKLTREILAMAKAAGADCIATACPLCQLNLDLRQKDTEKASGEAFNLPVFYFTHCSAWPSAFPARTWACAAWWSAPINF